MKLHDNVQISANHPQVRIEKRNLGLLNFKMKNTMSILPPVTSDELATLHAKTIIVTGGASGIGKATVAIAHSEIHMEYNCIIN